mmetsp:Transcript_13091/g.22095  ORF Transcript_13091/g.22095 Transcript_13091/m.22095 type:complete len:147 (-) Transcript_13091:20-460(-)
MQKDAAWVIAATASMNRNVRCSLAYLDTRLSRVERMAWESGKQIPDHLLENLSPAEAQYFKSYLDNVDNYSKSISNMFSSDSNNIDLTVDFNPPKDLFIEVRVNKDYGVVMLPESGEVRLQKNTTHLLRRSEVDNLIKRGIMAEVL